MKSLLLSASVLLLTLHLHAANAFDERWQFIYSATIEGAFADGLTNDDVDRILRKSGDGVYEHFVYACPLCMPVINALRAYRERPPLFGYKLSEHQDRHRTLGDGLDAALRAKLASDRVEPRLEAVNALVQRWVDRRLKLMNLTPDQRKTWNTRLEEGRKEGMKMLEKFRADGSLKVFAPGFANLKECAVCNAATGRPAMGGAK
ncbi:MAG: hypothetical protein FJ386_06170 [Verrucomicrobia bacterium]|nr:hypothetical protein [Verrucomicrobiota bacterium]